MVSTRVSGCVPGCSPHSQQTSLPQNASLLSRAPCRAQDHPGHGSHGQCAQPSGDKLPGEHRKTTHSLRAPALLLPARRSLPTTGTAHITEPASGGSAPSCRGRSLPVPEVCSAMNKERSWAPLSPVLGMPGHFPPLPPSLSHTRSSSYLFDHGRRAGLPSMDSTVNPTSFSFLQSKGGHAPVPSPAARSASPRAGTAHRA